MEYGICILGIIPLRKEAKDQSEIVSQVLFGQHFKILEITSKWIRIELATDNYEGWICAKQYEEITYEDYDNLNVNDFPLVASSFSNIQNVVTQEVLPITLGATLPFYHKGSIKIRKHKFKFTGNIASNDTNNLLKYAHELLNAPYLWGGKSILGIDCSGFTQVVYSLCGIHLPRDAYQQAELGETVTLNDINPADLVFFENDSNRIHHVGIALENNQIIHASGKVRIDQLNKEGIIHSKTKELTHRLHLIKRIIE
jgi:hypothetical protein